MSCRWGILAKAITLGQWYERHPSLMSSRWLTQPSWSCQRHGRACLTQSSVAPTALVTTGRTCAAVSAVWMEVAVAAEPSDGYSACSALRSCRSCCSGMACRSATNCRTADAMAREEGPRDVMRAPMPTACCVRWGIWTGGGRNQQRHHIGKMHPTDTSYTHATARRCIHKEAQFHHFSSCTDAAE